MKRSGSARTAARAHCSLAHIRRDARELRRSLCTRLTAPRPVSAARRPRTIEVVEHGEEALRDKQLQAPQGKVAELVHAQVVVWLVQLVLRTRTAMLNNQVRLLAYEDNVAVTLWDSGTTRCAQHM